MALAAAGVLACVAALFNIWVPRGSLLAFVLALPLLALAIVGIMFGFIKACEKCEDWLHGRRDRLFGVDMEDEDHSDVPVDPRQRTPRDSWPAAGEPLNSAARQDPTRYVFGPRGLSSPKSSNGGTTKPPAAQANPECRVWHGQ
jgi:hypothetical protein